MTDKSLEAHFIKCLKERDTKKALYIIKLLGDKVNALYGAKSLLVFAKEFENKEVARVLEEKGVREIISDEEAKKLGLELIEKAKVGDLDAVIEFVGKGADVNQKGFFDHTALIWASQNGHLEIVEKLIEAGANVNAKDVCSYTALMMASRNGHLEVVEKLIEKGVNVNHQDRYGLTALMMASEFGNLDVVEALLDAGAEVNIKSNTGSTAMSLAKNEETRRVIIEAVKKKKEKTDEKESSFKGRGEGDVFCLC